MPFEEFDNKLREAAENHHPAYDEKAWARMEKLLNKHLPQENDRRRRIIFLLLFFLVLGGGAAWLFSSKPWKGNKKETTATTTIRKPAGNIPAPFSSDAENATGENYTIKKKEIEDINASGNDNTVTKPLFPDQIPVLLNPAGQKDLLHNKPAPTTLHNKKINKDQPLQNIHNNQDPVTGIINKDRKDKDQVDPITANTTAAILVPDQNNNEKEVVAKENLTAITPVSIPAINDPAGRDKTNTGKTLLVQDSKEKQAKGKNRKRNTFFFTLSSGPDVSVTGGDKLGKTKLLAGGGLGYTFKDRLTIRSGFYTGRKIYTSSPASYHPPASFWNYYPNLEKVDADCKVYEIPLSLSYNLGQSSRQNWFVSAGISSYLMKEETYNYYYKYTTGGPTVQRKWTIYDKNKHYFSVLTLSGGYQKNIGKSFSIMAEPYMKLPLAGVGFGKVKLNSGGLLLSVGIKPFAGSGNHRKTQR